MIDNSTDLFFGKFRIIECLKKDACSAVYLSDHVYLDKKIILKTLDTENLADLSLLERFKREAKILASLEHPNIIKVLDFGMYEKFFYISFEYFKSRNLRRVIKENNLSEENKKKLIVQLLNGLAEAHNHNIVHRDIKPENILVGDNGILKIADFGLATILNDNTITNQYSIVGTPGYMSPEQINGEVLDCRSDLYSTGLVIQELYTGENPVIGKDINETINNILNFDEKNLYDFPSDETEIATIIKALLKRNINERIPTAIEALAILNVHELVKPGLSLTKKRSEKKIIFISILFFLVLAVLIYLFYRNQQQFHYQGSNKSQEKVNTTDFDTTKSVQDIEPDQVKINNIIEHKEDKKQQLLIEGSDKTDKELTSKKIENTLSVKSYGKLNIECLPWAVVYIDSQKIDTTPIKEVTLTEGNHLITLRHPDYPEYTSSIFVSSKNPNHLKINLDNLIGYLDCKIYPWGEVFINGVSKGQTPFTKPLALSSGQYKVVIKYPGYPDYSESINIRNGNVYTLKHSFIK